MKLFKIETGNFMCDGGAVFGVVPKVMWAKQYPCDEDNFCNLSMRCLLLDTGERKVLIDTGVGDKQSEKFYSYYRLNGTDTLIGSLQEAGYSPDDITDVLLTHLHFDHCGGCVVRDDKKAEKLLFPNATHWVAKGQWDNYKQPNVREGAVYFPENMQAVEAAKQLKIIDKEGEWIPGIVFKIVNGHTPGHIVPVINYNGRKIVFTGDLIPVAASIPLSWVSAYDVNPIASLKEKADFLKEAVEQDYVLFFEHDLYNECCTLQQTEKGVRLKEAFKLSDFI